MGFRNASLAAQWHSLSLRREIIAQRRDLTPSFKLTALYATDQLFGE